MQYDVSTAEEYLEALDNDWRKEKVLELRKILLSATDDIVEGINYKMLSYADSNGIICHLNAQKNYVGLYVGDAKKIDVEGTLLAGIDCGKGCVRFKKSNDASSDNIKEFITRKVQLWKDGVDFGC